MVIQRWIKNILYLIIVYSMTSDMDLQDILNFLPGSNKISRRSAMKIVGVGVAAVVVATGGYYLLIPRSTIDREKDLPSTDQPIGEPTPAPPAAVEKKSLIIGVTQEFQTLAPASTLAQPGGLAPLVQGLYDYFNYRGPVEGSNLATTLYPLVIKTAEPVDGKLGSIRLRVRENIRFSNGDALDSEAVAAAIRFYQGKGRPPRFRGATIEIEDKTSLVVTWRRASIRNLVALEDPLGTGPWIVHPDQVEEALALEGAKVGSMAEEPITSGPFTVKEFSPGASRVVMERNKDYWGAKEGIRFTGGNIDEVTWVVIKEPAAVLTALQSGDIDFSFSLAFNHVAVVDSDPNLNFKRSGAIRLGLFIVNTTVKPLDDVRVRKAMSHAISRKELLLLYENRVTEANGPLLPFELGYDPNMKNYTFDPDMAKTLLAEAGLKDGFDTEIQAARSAIDPVRVEIAQAISPMLQGVGINAKLTVSDPGTYVKNLLTRDSTVPIMPFSKSRDKSEPINEFDFFYTGGRGRRLAFKEDETLAAMMDSIGQTLDTAERTKKYTEAAQYILDNAYHIFTHYLERYQGFSSKIESKQWEGTIGFYPSSIIKQ